MNILAALQFCVAMEVLDDILADLLDTSDEEANSALQDIIIGKQVNLKSQISYRTNTPNRLQDTVVYNTLLNTD